MKIGILSRNLNIYSTRRIYDEAKKRNHHVEVLDVLKCYMNITSNKPSIHYKGEEKTGFDAIIPRIGASVTFYGNSVVRQFEMAGKYVLNPSLAIARARDKLRAHQLFAQKGIGMPVTGFAHSPGDKKDLINMVGGAPLVVKLLEGTQGKGVILAETKKAAESLIDAFRELNTFFLVQEYIGEAAGKDIRCFVIGDKVVASMQRTAQGDDFRSNLHRGGTAETIKITPKERKTAIEATKAMGLKVAGVDIVRSERGPLVLEVNTSPGLEGIEKATGKNIAGMIIDFIEKDFPNHKPHKKKSA